MVGLALGKTGFGFDIAIISPRTGRAGIGFSYGGLKRLKINGGLLIDPSPLKGADQQRA